MFILQSSSTMEDYSEGKIGEIKKEGIGGKEIRFEIGKRGLNLHNSSQHSHS